jgi:hypothetical protein
MRSSQDRTMHREGGAEGHAGRAWAAPVILRALRDDPDIRGPRCAQPFDHSRSGLSRADCGPERCGSPYSPRPGVGRDRPRPTPRPRRTSNRPSGRMTAASGGVRASGSLASIKVTSPDRRGENRAGDHQEDQQQKDHVDQRDERIGARRFGAAACESRLSQGPRHRPSPEGRSTIRRSTSRCDETSSPTDTRMRVVRLRSGATSRRAGRRVARPCRRHSGSACPPPAAGRSERMRRSASRADGRRGEADLSEPGECRTQQKEQQQDEDHVDEGRERDRAPPGRALRCIDQFQPGAGRCLGYRTPGPVRRKPPARRRQGRGPLRCGFPASSAPASSA